MTASNAFETANQNNAFTFSESEKTQIRKVLTEKLGIKDANTQTAFIDYVQSSGTLPAFGCGSLLTYSHLEKAAPSENGTPNFKDTLLEKFPDLKTEELYDLKEAALYGYENDFVCHDIFYRGTKEFPGVTIGIDEVEDGVTYGGVLATNMTKLGLQSDQAADFVCYYLEEFANREFPPNMPIYKFDLKEMTLADGSTMPGLACIADQDGPLYAGNLSFEERATILATAMGTHNPTTGEPKPAGMITDLDYMRAMIDSKIEKDLVVEDRFIQLYTRAVEIRHTLDAETLQELKSHEKEGAHSNAIEFKSEGNIPTRWNLEPNTSCRQAPQAAL